MNVINSYSFNFFFCVFFFFFLCFFFFFFCWMFVGSGKKRPLADGWYHLTDGVTRQRQSFSKRPISKLRPFSRSSSAPSDSSAHALRGPHSNDNIDMFIPVQRRWLTCNDDLIQLRWIFRAFKMNERDECNLSRPLITF